MRIAALSSVLLLCACGDFGAITPDPDYCGENDGDAYCGRVAPGKPFCVVGEQSCFDAGGIDLIDPYGCVAALPTLECRNECGVDGGDECADETMSGSETSTGDDTENPPTSTTTGDTETEDESSSTTGPECSETIPCLDAEAPFCVDGTCATCEASVEPMPDEACAMLDAGFPLCVGTQCVQCSEESAEACGDETPLCDVASNSCVGCSFHEECQELGMPACNIATGACFSADDVTMVNLAGANALQTAVNGVADGAQHALLITGSAASNHSATVDGGKTIAIVSMNESIQTVLGVPAGSTPTLTVSGVTSRVFLHRLRLEGSNDVGISVGSGGTLYADSVRVAGNDGGGIELASGTSGFLRNCMVGGAADVATVDASSATVEVLYSSVLGGLGDADGFVCSSGTNISIRNSIITTRGSTPALGCAGAEVSASAIEDSGMTAWFADYNGGDATLTATGQAEFANAAVWELGDPLFDFDGDDRPNRDGAMDYAGADVP